jgi:hypothetical protein
MGAWKLVAYPAGLAIVGMVLIDLIGILAFGANSQDWLEWQNRAVSAGGVVTGLGGVMFGLYLAIRAHARLLP